MITLNEAKEKLANFEPFRAGNLSAWYVGDQYYVLSYDEVIGHATRNGKARNYSYNAYTFSKTTSKHTNLMRKAWGI